jgi:hypothetical protein
LTATAYTVTTGALAAPGAAGAAIVDVGAAALDVAAGDTSLRRGAVVLTAVVAGTALHLRFADDAVAGVGGLARRGASGGSGPVRIGQAGERYAGITGPKLKVRIPGTGRLRIPDEITPALVREVKNREFVALTQQIRDDITLAQATNRVFVLEVRSSTRLSRPLQNAINEGLIELRRTLP